MGRKITVLVVLLCMLLASGVRLYFLASHSFVVSGVSGATKTMTVSQLRGNIYDCNMKKLVNENEKTYVAAKPCVQSADLLKEHLSRQQYLKLLSCISKQEMFYEPIENYECNEETAKTSKVYERYDKDQTACHVIGYINSTDNIGVSALEKSYDDFLKENMLTLKLRYSENAKNSFLIGDKIDFLQENYNSKKGIKLTLDKDIQQICENAMNLYSNNCGACVVMDAQKSEIKAMASTPSFEPDNVSKYLTDENAPLINRALTSYSVGSVFKTVVAAAAIKNGYEGYEYDCKGTIEIGNKHFSCSSSTSHAREDISKALANSCNTFFISLAMQLGSKKIIETAENLGFSQEYVLCDDIVSDSGYLPSENEINTDGALANLAFGQGTLMATPLQVAVCYSALITDGTLVFPKLISGFVDDDGNETDYKRNYFEIRAVEPEITQKVKMLLEKNFSYSNYSSAKPSYDCPAGGKTSTAQTGWYDDNGKEIFHSWFAGFVTVGATDYVIVVFKENGKSGAEDCSPVFKEIADRIIIYNRN